MQKGQFNIPDKAQFRPEEVVRLTRLDTRVLTFWAKEFEGINPIRLDTGQMVYTKVAVERILTIKHLLVEERLDKENVRNKLKESLTADKTVVTKQVLKSPSEKQKTLNQIKQGLKEILTILDRDAKI